ncbi:MAG: hypothetical protein FJ271_30515 [Planctomycetes bacterium]|nr:hypothetical protein [Planctomycetota bacterium]
MSAHPDDLPPEAAEALPLAQAFREHADPELDAAYRLARDRLESEGHWQYFGPPGNPTGFVLSEFDANGQALLKEKRRIILAIEADFVAKLQRGELTAWARVGSPLAPWREIPASAWSTVQIDDLAKGTASGPGIILFDVRVGLRVAVPAPQPDAKPATTPPLAPTGDAGKPEKGATLYTAEFERRRAAGQLEPSLPREAAALLAWFKTNYPERQAPTAKTIANRLRAPYRAACPQ